MKVLYIGHYREGSGWAQAAIDYILALDKVGVDVVCRAVKLNSANPKLPDRILELESKPLAGCDICIQHVLPHLMDYDGRFKKNVGLFVAETLDITYSGWPSRLNMMDEIWVPNAEMVFTCKYSGVTKPVKVINHASNTAKFDKSYDTFELPYQIKDKYKFYFIGENIRRKHLSALLIAFYTKFSINDNVCLVIKANKSGVSPADCLNEVKEGVKEVKRNLRMYANEAEYPSYCCVTDFLTEEQIMSIHQQCDCFVMPSFGEAWCIPAFEAMGFNNYVLATDCGGFREFLPKHSLVKATIEPVFGYDLVFDDMHNGFDKWHNISIEALAQKMYTVYANKLKFDSGRGQAENYSHYYIGQIMKGVLCQ